MRRIAGLVGVFLVLGAPSFAETATPRVVQNPAPVVVATFDTGTNPFHPCFQRDWDSSGVATPRDLIPTYPKKARPLPLSMSGDYYSSLEASKPTLEAIKPDTLYYVPETNLSFIGSGPAANSQLVDDYPHGAQASSQIACDDYGLGGNAHLVIVNWFDQRLVANQLLRWAADQRWIDIIHLNIQDLPLPAPGIVKNNVAYAVARGKLVVIAGGNGVNGLSANYPSELSQYTGPPGSLVVGANDNEGWTIYSNLDPHVVMDGGETAAAAPDSFEETNFNGTSSSSPRTAGYAARLLGEARSRLGHTWSGLLTIPSDRARPSSGPLEDGKLTASELHEVIRKTANPNPHESVYDGNRSIFWVPQPADLPFAFYPKMGYGELSEHTLPLALDVLLGREAMPERPVEDSYYQESERARATIWN